MFIVIFALWAAIGAVLGIGIQALCMLIAPWGFVIGTVLAVPIGAHGAIRVAAWMDGDQHNSGGIAIAIFSLALGGLGGLLGALGWAIFHT